MIVFISKLLLLFLPKISGLKMKLKLSGHLLSIVYSISNSGTDKLQLSFPSTFRRLINWLSMNYLYLLYLPARAVRAGPGLFANGPGPGRAYLLTGRAGPGQKEKMAGRAGPPFFRPVSCPGVYVCGKVDLS